MWLLQNQEGLTPAMYQPQQVGVVVEMARAMEDGQLTTLETQRVMDASLAFGISLIFGMALGILVRSLVTEALEPREEKVVQPVIDLMLSETKAETDDDYLVQPPAPGEHLKLKGIETLDRLIRGKKNDPSWEKWPHGSVSDARKAVYKEILEGFRSLGEAREYIEGLPEDNVIFTARGDEISFSLIKTIIADIKRNPWLSPFRTERPERSWQPPLMPRTHNSIPTEELKRIAGKYGLWAARQAEALCPHNDIACVEREAKRLYEVVRQRMSA